MKKAIIAIVVIAIIAVAAFFGLKSNKNTTTAQVETTIAETTVTETTAETTVPEAVEPLKKEDLNIVKNNETSNIIDNNQKIQMITENDTDAKTNRGIKVGDSKEKVMVTYGDISISPISREEHDIYDYLKNQSDVDQKIKDALDDGDLYAEYVYHDGESDKDYAIGFWFDPENNVKLICNYEKGLMDADEVESIAEEELEEELKEKSKD